VEVEVSHQLHDKARMLYHTYATSRLWASFFWNVAFACDLLAILFSCIAKKSISTYCIQARRSTSSVRHWAHRHTSFTRGVEEWMLDEVITTLPFLFHLALFLFGAGLSIFLVPLDAASSHAVGIAVSLSAALYLTASIAPFIWPACPFDTPLVPLVYQIGRLVQKTARPGSVSLYMSWESLRAKLLGLTSVGKQLLQHDAEAILRIVRRLHSPESVEIALDAIGKLDVSSFIEFVITEYVTQPPPKLNTPGDGDGQQAASERKSISVGEGETEPDTREMLTTATVSPTCARPKFPSPLETLKSSPEIAAAVRAQLVCLLAQGASASVTAVAALLRAMLFLGTTYHTEADAALKDSLETALKVWSQFKKHDLFIISRIILLDSCSLQVRHSDIISKEHGESLDLYAFTGMSEVARWAMDHPEERPYEPATLKLLVMYNRQRMKNTPDCVVLDVMTFVCVEVLYVHATLGVEGLARSNALDLVSLLLQSAPGFKNLGGEFDTDLRIQILEFMNCSVGSSGSAEFDPDRAKLAHHTRIVLLASFEQHQSPLKLSALERCLSFFNVAEPLPKDWTEASLTGAVSLFRLSLAAARKSPAMGHAWSRELGGILRGLLAAVFYPNAASWSRQSLIDSFAEIFAELALSTAAASSASHITDTNQEPSSSEDVLLSSILNLLQVGPPGPTLSCWGMAADRSILRNSTIQLTTQLVGLLISAHTRAPGSQVTAYADELIGGEARPDSSEDAIKYDAAVERLHGICSPLKWEDIQKAKNVPVAPTAVGQVATPRVSSPASAASATPKRTQTPSPLVPQSSSISRQQTPPRQRWRSSSGVGESDAEDVGDVVLVERRSRLNHTKGSPSISRSSSPSGSPGPSQRPRSPLRIDVGKSVARPRSPLPEPNSPNNRKSHGFGDLGRQITRSQSAQSNFHSRQHEYAQNNSLGSIASALSEGSLATPIPIRWAKGLPASFARSKSPIGQTIASLGYDTVSAGRSNEEQRGRAGRTLVSNDDRPHTPSSFSASRTRSRLRESYGGHESDSVTTGSEISGDDIPTPTVHSAGSSSNGRPPFEAE